jgi:hypothetical protein
MKTGAVQGVFSHWAETTSGLSQNLRYDAKNQGVMGKCLSRPIGESKIFPRGRRPEVIDAYAAAIFHLDVALGRPS